MPVWLTWLSVISLLLAVACAIWIARDCRRRPQPMKIMSFVWPLSALFGSGLLLWFYLRQGRAHPPEHHGSEHNDHHHHHHHGNSPFPVAVAKGAFHCGSGCTLGDMVAETLALLFPVLLVPLGFPGVFEEKMFAVWILDFIFAFGIGIVFQYFAIAPMRDVTVWQGIKAAIKADTLSLAAWQVGMYGLMAIAIFGIYRPIYGTAPDASSPVFWFTMQIAMIAGFMTAYPMNWWLIRLGVKEQM